MAAVEALCAEVRADVKAAVEASGNKWKDSKWSGFTAEVVSFLLGKGEDVGDVVAATVGLILYGATTEEKLQAVADDKEGFKRQLTVDKYGVPAAICDLLFAEYVAGAVGAAPSAAEVTRLKRERDEATNRAETATARAETAEDTAGLTRQSLWNSKWRLNQLAYVLPDEAMRSKRSKSSRSTSEWPGPDEVAPWNDFCVTCPGDDIETNERFVLAKDGMRDIGMITSEADLVQSVLSPQLNTIFRHGVQRWFCRTADLHFEYPVAQGVIPDGMIFRRLDDSEPVLPIEVKHPAAYLPHEDMVKQWKQGKTKGEVALKAGPIRQIYTYMCLSKSTYGILSTYQRTWFICRALEVKNGEERSVMKFSRPFYPTSSEPTLAQAIVYVTWLALQPRVPLNIPKSAEDYLTKIKTANADAIMSGKKARQGASRSDGGGASSSGGRSSQRGSRTRKSVNEGSGVKAPAATDALPLQDIDVEFKPIETFPGLNHGVAHRMDVHGYDSVVKLVDADKDREGASILAREAKIYAKLRDLWGDAIPSMVCSGPVSLGREMLVITYEGKSLDEIETSTTTPAAIKQIKCNARRALAALHDHGVVHGDLALRNIVYDEVTSSVKLIDLANSHEPEDKSAFSSESAYLKQVLMDLKCAPTRAQRVLGETVCV